MIADIQSTAEMAKVAEQLKYATIVVSSLPLLIMYPFSRNILIKESWLDLLRANRRMSMDMKKRSFKKLITLSLTLAMLTGVAGCGKQQSLNAETNPDTPASDVQFPLKEKAELSFITSAPATSTQDPNERTIFKRMEKQTNVHIDWTCFVSDQFSDKKNLALAQFGNLPDGLFNAGMSDYDLLRYAKQGIIIPVENLIDKYMPNLQAVFEKYPEYRTMCTAPDGHIYSFPWIEQLGAGKEAIQAIGDIPYINKKWLDYLGLEVPTTTDELEPGAYSHSEIMQTSLRKSLTLRAVSFLCHLL